MSGRHAVAAPASTAAIPARYPFSAVVGQERLKLALILCAVSPGIGGVLIRGEKGTAKSTIVRGLGPLIAHEGSAHEGVSASSAGRVVELPIGATEDRVVGSLDLTAVLRDGEAVFTPGLLARADGGVLYIDEVNLLADHLVDVLLDAAASGRVTIERDGVSHTQAADFVLVGTMNPEEGELRPQLLDRFGLAVDVTAAREVDERVEVVRRRMDFDADPDRFVERYADDERVLSDRIAAARGSVGSVEISERELRRIAGICAHLDVDGLRGDIVVARTAAAHAALRGATSVTEEDVRVGVELALPHRRRRDPFDESGMSEQQLDDALSAGDDAAGPPDEPEPDPDGPTVLPRPSGARSSTGPPLTQIPLAHNRIPVTSRSSRKCPGSRSSRRAARCSAPRRRAPVCACVACGPTASAMAIRVSAHAHGVVVDTPCPTPTSRTVGPFISSGQCCAPQVARWPPPRYRRCPRGYRSHRSIFVGHNASGRRAIWWCSSST